MKYALAGILAALLMTTATLEANAVVCARGVYRAGCVGPNGAAVVRTAPYARPAYAHPYAHPYVHPYGYRCYWRAGVRICP